MAEALILLLTQDAADLDVGATRLLGAHLNTWVELKEGAGGRS